MKVNTVEIVKRVYIVFTTIFRKLKRTSKHDIYDCVVVCGYPANNDGSPSDFMKTRVKKAAELMLDDKAKYLILSGGAVANSYIEAEVMKAYAMKLGVKEEVIIEEKKAVSTYHNMLYVKQIMEEKRFKNCIVVTNGWHLRKADYYSGKFGFDYVMVKSKEPEGMNAFQTMKQYVYINMQMYYMMLKGYY